MSSKNVDAVRPIYDEWGRGNFFPSFDVYDPHMEWGWSEEFPGLAGVYRDPAVRSSRLREWLSPWEHWTCEAEEYLERGDYVVVLCRYRGTGKGSGVEVDTRGAHVLKLRGGKVVRLEVFADRARALESAGIQGPR
jgi:ketosteroid isomerase-like protein